MSKKQATEVVPAAEEEWEDVDEEEEEDTTINNPEVVNKYKKAAAWANEALQEVIKLCKPDAVIADVCKAGDEKIKELVTKMFKGVEKKGVGFPTTLSVNNCVAYQCAVPGEEGSDKKLALNDMVKIDLGVHVDGYIAQVADTIQVTANGELNPESKEAQIIAAAHQIIDTAIRNLRPGMETYAITDIIEKATAHFGFNNIDGVLSHQVRQFIIDNFNTISNKSTADYRVHSYDIQPMTVWAIDIVITSGKGKLREGDGKPGIFKSALEDVGAPRGAAAQEVSKEIDKKYSVFPFAVRNLEHKKARLALAELVKTGAVYRYAPLMERENTIVAQCKMTVLLTEKKIERITGIPAQKGAPAPKPYESDELKAAAAQKFTLVEKKKAEKKE